MSMLSLAEIGSLLRDFLGGRSVIKRMREDNRRSHGPVSAFFLIDSQKAITRCMEQLEALSACGLPSLDDPRHVWKVLRFFRKVRRIHQMKQDVGNVSLDIPFRWHGEDCGLMLRCHSVDQDRHQIEAWIPGIIADRASHLFGNGRKAFWCDFMPPSFYD